MDNKEEEIYKIVAVPVKEFYYSDITFWGSYRIETLNKVPYFKRTIMNDFNMVNNSKNEDMFSGSISGNMQQLNIGEEYIIEGTLSKHEKYGYSLKPILIKQNIPTSKEQQLNFLKSIITEKQAESLLEVYPNIVDDIINGKKDFDLTKAKGITVNNMDKILNKIIDNFVISDVLSYLSPLGISYEMIKKISDIYSSPILLKQKIMENPYMLTSINGLGFKKVDAIALNINSDLRSSKFRAISFIRYYLHDVSESLGHACISVEELKREFMNNVPECLDFFDEILSSQDDESTFIHVENNTVGLKRSYEREKEIIDKLQMIANTKPIRNVTQENIDKGIEIANEKQGFEFDENQVKIINKIVRQKVSTLSGLGGTSKSTTSRGILNVFSQARMSISCCSLSAKAALVIEESTGFGASTIHSLFRIGKRRRDENDDGMLSTDVLFIDECSMINDELFHYMFTHIPSSTIVIMVGDDKQLPAIGCGNLFGELLLPNNHIENTSAFVLKKIYRQANDSGIIHDANIIRFNKNPLGQLKSKMVSGVLKDMFYLFYDNKESIHEEAVSKYVSSVNKHGVENVVLAVPRKDTCLNSCEKFNNEIQEILLKGKHSIVFGKKKFYLGARVMQLVNNYDNNVVNGDVGIVSQINLENNSMIIKFDNGMLVEYDKRNINEITLSYAVTCHKLQGSSSKVVIGVIDKSHYMLLDSCMLYTMLTRARKQCLLISEPFAFQQCIRNNKQINRMTYYSSLIENLKGDDNNG